METNPDFTDILRLLARSAEHPDPDGSPLSDITDFGDQAVPLLIEALTHDDPVIRRTAAETLGQLRSPGENRLDLQPAILHLEKMIESDADALVRLHAAEAIWNITGDKTVVPGFIEALSHADVESRRFAVSMIGLVEADLQNVIQPLIAALADPNPFVRGTAAMVLADYGENAAEAVTHLERLLEEDGFTKITAAHAVICIEPGRTEELTPLLTEALTSRDKTVRRRAAQVFGEIPAAGAIAIHSLIQTLGDDEDGVRFTVLNTLNNLGTAAAPATAALVEILVGSDDIIERGIAAEVLKSIGPAAKGAIPQLLTCLQEPMDSAARIYFHLKVAHALWCISGETEHLLAMGLEVIRSPEWWLRWQGAGSLGELGSAGRVAILELSSLLEDEHQFVRRSAAESLRKINATV
ncbi:MAG: HEAT repeat domain-containing protein [Pirellulaceae bacterium]